MSREIKFRGQKLETKEWVYGSLVSSKTNPVAIIQQRYNPIFNGEATGWCFGIIAETVGQYTGLKDHNGKDIYEGDRIYDAHAPNDERELYVVKYDESMGRYWLDGEFPPEFHETDFVVYDNIHEPKPTKELEQ